MSKFSKFSELSTDELSELLPNNVQPARRDYAPENDRWRMFSTGSNTYCDTGASSFRNLLIMFLDAEEEARQNWMKK
jgi:hypothetical protein